MASTKRKWKYVWLLKWAIQVDQCWKIFVIFIRNVTYTIFFIINFIIIKQSNYYWFLFKWSNLYHFNYYLSFTIYHFNEFFFLKRIMAIDLLYIWILGLKFSTIYINMKIVISWYHWNVYYTKAFKKYGGLHHVLYTHKRKKESSPQKL